MGAAVPASLPASNACLARCRLRGDAGERRGERRRRIRARVVREPDERVSMPSKSDVSVSSLSPGMVVSTSV